MNAWWLQFSAPVSARFEAYSARERALIFAGVVGGILLLGWVVLLEPQLRAASNGKSAIVEQRERLAAVQAQLVELQSPARDPDVAARAQLEAASQRLSELNARFATLESSLVPPQNMSRLLEDLIGRNSSLRLLSLRTLPVSAVAEAKAASRTTAPDGNAEAAKAASKPASVDSGAAKEAAPVAGLFKHGVEIRLEGSYQDLAAYLARVEKSPAKLLWSEVSLAAEKQPRLVLTLTVYTLSLDRAWLIV
ncbi:hypothetical protein GH865_05405 [Rhodocyclus tenuis]|uniref:type II secretion system protein GspM n=1 Tax=Rhodocyclus gracilis TaxID=2929842 RepID=UPI00129891F0|nr:type II secretion system protein GspM [Rhodocyclus gracilis]MRD72687.1 hypothetical protein [Rhodocyclus gracilis]